MIKPEATQAFDNICCRSSLFAVSLIVTEMNVLPTLLMSEHLGTPSLNWQALVIFLKSKIRIVSSRLLFSMGSVLYTNFYSLLLDLQKLRGVSKGGKERRKAFENPKKCVLNRGAPQFADMRLLWIEHSASRFHVLKFGFSLALSQVS